MSIPDDVVERVARAIAAVEYGNDAPDISIGETHLALARAALSASGYVEMREALAELVAIDDEHGLGDVYATYDGRQNRAVEKARAALTVKREGGQ